MKKKKCRSLLSMRISNVREQWHCSVRVGAKDVQLRKRSRIFLVCSSLFWKKKKKHLNKKCVFSWQNGKKAKRTRRELKCVVIFGYVHLYTYTIYKKCIWYRGERIGTRTKGRRIRLTKMWVKKVSNHFSFYVRAASAERNKNQKFARRVHRLWGY